MAKKKRTLTKKERKAQEREKLAAAGVSPPEHQHHHQHIHCIACGRHIDASEFDLTPPTAMIITCDHGSQFASCTSCSVQSKLLVETHDRTNQPVKAAAAWH